MPDWEQNAKDSEKILCDSGDLLRECYDELKLAGRDAMAEKVKAFCDRVWFCMMSGQKWIPMDDLIGTAIVLLMVAGLFARDITKWWRKYRG